MSRVIRIISGIFLVGVIWVTAVPGYARCVPDCEGKECGDDGCGGTCGTCKPPAQCVIDRCVKGCGAFGIPEDPWISCCYKGYALQCGYDEKNDRFVWDVHKCKSEDECRWRRISLAYRCDSSSPYYEDPSGREPRECNFECKPDCKGKNCGPDGCGGTCGECDGRCINGRCCHPDCEGKDCGSDGCGGTCGFCNSVESCDHGHCVHQYGCKITITPGCPDCACEKCVCEKDPPCCFARWDNQCVRECKTQCGGCRKCVPDCDGKDCGSDGCDGFCGYCKPGFKCEDNKCVKCVPDCKDKECGDDGCGGSCGECSDSEVCDKGHCRPCKTECGSGMNCGYFECAGPCNSEYNPNPDTPDCPSDMVCMNNYCIPCEPYCKDRECGDDGCGGSCGKCGPCEECISRHCKKVPDCKAPEPVPDEAEEAGRDAWIDEVGSASDVKEQKDTAVKQDTKTTHDLMPSDSPIKRDLGYETEIRDHMPPARPSSGSGCTTSGRGRLPYWLILLFAPLLYLRKRKED